MAKYLISGPILGKFGPPKLFFREFYLYLMLDIIASYHFKQFQGKLMNLIWKNGQKPYFRPDFGPNLATKIFFFLKI